MYVVFSHLMTKTACWNSLNLDQIICKAGIKTGGKEEPEIAYKTTAFLQ